MKLFLALTLSSLALGAWAQDDLATMKRDANSHLDQKMTHLEEARNCINAATTVDKFKACKYDMREEMKKTKMQAMEEKVKGLGKKVKGDAE